MLRALPARRTCVNLAAMNRAHTRRQFLRLLVGPPLLAAGVSGAGAAKVEGARTGGTQTALIERLIGEARALPNVSERIDFISRRLLGIRYQANTLIGSPKSAEKFVVRDDAFDCVTFCEVVLAAAIARDMAEFETSLRRIRYDHGNVQYDRRNHYFADWCQRNIENGICRPVKIEPSIVIDKILTWHREFGQHPVSISAIAKETLLQNAKLLAPGDIIGFTSRRVGLDYYHTGLVAFGKTGELLLRNASQSRGRVVEDKMAAFVSVNPVKYVTLLRVVNNPPVVERR
jgi:N-acetylmuramoyl-L-alanine amidase-like